ncbi:MAG: zinc ABC transporter substrate-binding protein [Rhizobiaceae bacterium]
MRLVKPFFFASTLFASATFGAQAQVKVVTSIKPVHSLVAAVMDGVGMPYLIIEGAGSPHTYALKPSQAQKLETADLVFWMGHELEAFLEKPLEAIATRAKTIELLDAHGLTKLKFREGGAFDDHDHDDEEHGEEHSDDHDEEKHEEHDDGDKHADNKHADDKHADHDHDDDKHDGDEHAEKHEGDEHKHGSFDPHVWLDPINAKALIHEIEETLVEADPANAAKYQANAKSVSDKLDELTAEVAAQLEPVKSKPFVVFHDAYQNFEQRFGLSAIGSITVSPETMPGAERIRELQTKINELNANCVFSEPQFDPKLVVTVSQGTQARTGVLDPLGTSIEDGRELYFKLIRNMATAIKDCLQEAK